jgi:hypothetical protein
MADPARAAASVGLAEILGGLLRDPEALRELRGILFQHAPEGLF